MPSKNIIMPESQGSVLCVEANDAVTYQYYTDVYLKHLEEIFKTYGEGRLLFWYPHPESFPGWETKAAELDLSKFHEYSKNIKKVALVNAPPIVSQRWDFRMPFLAGEFREFEKDQLPIALDWIKS